MAIRTLGEFGRELRKLINGDEVFALLEEGLGNDWGSGGCWILAAAVAEHLGPPAKLMAIRSDSNLVEHVVVQYGDLYVDYKGTSDLRKLLGDFKSEYPYRTGIRLVPFTAKMKQEAFDNVMIPYEPRIVKLLTSILNREFGS